MKGNCLMIAAVLIASLAACGGGGADNTTGTGTGNGNGNGGGNNPGCTAGNGVICVEGTSFNPVNITISKNGTATWTEDVGVHNIVFDGPPPGATAITDIGSFSEGSVNRTFVTAGSYPYHCTIHGGVGSGMHGTVVVQ